MHAASVSQARVFVSVIPTWPFNVARTTVLVLFYINSFNQKAMDTDSDICLSP